MSGGVVTGGWSFVIAAYAVTGAVLLFYGVSLAVRLRAERMRKATEGERP